MPQNPLLIAMEHHRSGRLRLAEEGYRALLDTEPGHPDALHWLGILTYQAGRIDEAIDLLARATQLRPDDQAFWFNLGQAYTSAGRSDDAINALARAAKLDPAHGQTLLALGKAHLARQGPDDPQAAIEALKQAQAAGIDSHEVHDDLGRAWLARGRVDEAIAAFDAALRKNPGYAPAYHHLALAYRARGDAKQVRKCLNKALEMDPGLWRAWHALAVLDAESGNLAQSAALFRRAIRVKSDYLAAYEGLAQVLRRAGQHAQAADAAGKAEELAQSAIHASSATASSGTVADLEQRLTPDPRMAQLHFALAARLHLRPPTHVPVSSVTDLFENYATGFDEHLRGALQYRAPELLAEAVAATRPDRLLDTLDMGCGTGLCGPLLRAMARTLAGVDLAGAMIEKAKERGVYDRLEVGDLLDCLRRSPGGFDLLVAADVLIYLGDLAPTFEASATALRTGGLLAFSVESAGGDHYYLNGRTKRYTHSKPYLQRLAAMYGFEITSIASTVLRVELDQPVVGYLVVLKLAEG